MDFQLHFYTQLNEKQLHTTDDQNYICKHSITKKKCRNSIITIIIEYK